MGYYDGYLILSDIDGTLTLQGNEISPENLRALRHFMDNGGYFTLATGRTTKFLPDFPIQPNAPLVAVNGTWVVDASGETLQFLPITDDPESVIRYFLDSYPGIIKAYRFGRFDARIWFREKDGTDLSLLLDKEEPCLKYYFTCENEPTALRLMDDAIRRFGDRYEFNRSWADGMEMHAKGSGKDAGLRFLRSWLPGIRTVIAVGNYENDIPMLRAADIGCAVGDAIDSVKEAADRVIVPCGEHALACIIEHMIPSLKETS